MLEKGRCENVPSLRKKSRPALTERPKTELKTDYTYVYILNCQNLAHSDVSIFSALSQNFSMRQ
jgi:hypothetical protein